MLILILLKKIVNENFQSKIEKESKQAILNSGKK